MNFRSARDEQPDINLTPLIDIVFLLLIFFMVTSTFKENKSEIQIELPEAVGQPVEKLEFSIDITIDSLGRYFVNRQAAGHGKLSQLIEVVKSVAGKHKDPAVTIHSDRKAPYQAVVTAMDAVKQLGMYKISLRTIKADDSK